MDSFDEITHDAIEHLNNVWEAHENEIISNINGCNEFHSYYFEIQIDKEQEELNVSFNILNMPLLVCYMTINLLDFCYDHGLEYVLRDNFFVRNDKKVYGEEAEREFNRMIDKDVQEKMKNEQFYNNLLNLEGMIEN